MFYSYYYGGYFIILLPAIILSLYASIKVNSTFSKYAKVRNSSGLTGYDCARRILDMNGLSYIPIERVSGSLTDHYDPGKKVLRLSDSVYDADTISAISVAAHECGHAIQHQQEYAPLSIRNAIFPVVNIASYASWIFIVLGIVLSSFSFLVPFGIALFAATVAFQLITLPVEFDASNRAVKILSQTGMVYGGEAKAAKNVLSAAALTYVADALSAVLQLLRLVLIFGDNR